MNSACNENCCNLKLIFFYSGKYSHTHSPTHTHYPSPSLTQVGTDFLIISMESVMLNH